MKKLMIAAAVALAGVAVNAASFNWETNGDQTMVDHTGAVLDEEEGTAGYFVYLMVGTGTDAGSGDLLTYAYADAVKAIGEGSVAFLSNEMNANGPVSPFMGTASDGSLDVLAKEKAFTAYLVVTDADKDHLADATYAWISAEMGGSVDGYGNATPSPITFDVASTDGGWTKLTSSPEPVPEPTSGLLLLLGVAGLALRRRRA